MEYWYLIISGIISFVGMLFHGIAGHLKYIGAINDSSLEPLTKSLSLVSWHVFTIFLFVGSVVLFYVAYNPATTLALYPVIVVNLLGALLFIFLGLGSHKALLKMPGAYLMGFTAIFAYLGMG
ncbi:hypothetical protein N9450_02535 [Gammaproteobacteria bacterium]|nr:hypothetical protein [Gammaproteobacteria bacterium]MDB3976098.1 hypothetical protein [Gammaproteobacteria bacterium]MDB3994592.1 hypothetical protein [Gammaproteobacteria bacterium]MDB4816196.1 hypothetical protein [Gammaproteobacteria bacterium]MDC0508865.1 hypothetical protein [Gammaproteobacteria bacterium]